jgi:cytochrome-b5 reductase
MATKTDDDGAFSRRHRDYIYIPAGLLIVGTMIVKIDWTPYAVALALVLGTWNYFTFRE